ncbi:hypothetical protein Daus18300_011930 [Diaporthe australafricana]|uniref:DUF7025 domain-containing protein n=1 Tax=Diaporthe australafricana TaxID=127596 RepID=A0ABR3W4P0_9PEZI
MNDASWGINASIPMNLYDWPDNDLFSVYTLPPLPAVNAVDTVIGEKVAVQRFYEGPPTCKCCKNWVERPPNQMPEEAKEKYDGAAIRIYTGKDHVEETHGGLKELKVQFIIIQSPIIRKEIAPILEKAGLIGVPVGDAKELKIKAPFKDLFFTHPQLVELCHSHEAGSLERQHLQLLVDVMEDLFHRTTARVSELHEKGLMEFEHTWTMFPRGIIVHSRISGLDQLFQVEEARMRGPDCRIECRYVRFDGRKFGKAKRVLFIKEFQNTRRIRDLEVYPIGFHADAKRWEARLIERGSRLLEFNKMSYVQHHGPAKACRHDGGRKNVSGRVIIDAFAFAKFQPWYNVKAESLHKNDPEPRRRVSVSEPDKHKVDKSDEHEVDESDEDDVDDSDEDEVESAAPNKPTSQELAENKALVASRREWLMTIDPFLPGFSLTDKKWYWLPIDALSSIQWNTAAFDQLLLHEDKKDLILSFVKNHEITRSLTIDLIQGKGQGLVVLLSGGSGTGKTLTAEAVMLASLEYYSGIILLNTNMPRGIDSAIMSRLDVHLKYPDFDFDNRRKLWSSFLDNSRGSLSDAGLRVIVSGDDLDELAAWKLNGREIKSSFKNAAKWCFIKRTDISMRALRTGIDVTAPLAERDDSEGRSEPAARKRPRAE